MQTFYSIIFSDLNCYFKLLYSSSCLLVLFLFKVGDPDLEAVGRVFGGVELLDDVVPESGETGQDGVPQSSLRIVILHGHNSPTTGRAVILDGRPIQRFDGERIQDPDVDSL